MAWQTLTESSLLCCSTEASSSSVVSRNLPAELSCCESCASLGVSCRERVRTLEARLSSSRLVSLSKRASKRRFSLTSPSIWKWWSLSWEGVYQGCVPYHLLHLLLELGLRAAQHLAVLLLQTPDLAFVPSSALLESCAFLGELLALEERVSVAWKEPRTFPWLSFSSAESSSCLERSEETCPRAPCRAAWASASLAVRSSIVAFASPLVACSSLWHAETPSSSD